MLLALAWRNLWRNPRRTIITVSALTAGVIAIVFMFSYRESAFTMMLRGITTGLIGQMQVHGRGYQESPELGTVVRNPKAVEAVIAGALPGAQSERRVVGAGLAGVGESAAPAMVLGMEPAHGSSLFTIVEGADVGATAAKKVVLGNGLAEDLGAKVGSELILVGQAADGSVANDRYVVTGIATTQSSEMDLRAVFLHIADAQDFFGLGDSVHQIVVRLPTDEEDLSKPVSVLRGALDLSSLEALSWSEITPELKGTLEEKRKGQSVLNYVIFLIVALGVLNATSMSTFERTREFGVLASLGTRPRRILGLVLTEALLQGALSLAIGLTLVAALLYGLGGISMAAFSGQDVLGVRMPTYIELELQWGAVRGAAATVLVTVVLGSLLPAIRAARLRPAEAARRV
jgi:ABC-type lipoprotein release transport system permease subunit